MCKAGVSRDLREGLAGLALGVSPAVELSPFARSRKKPTYTVHFVGLGRSWAASRDDSNFTAQHGLSWGFTSPPSLLTPAPFSPCSPAPFSPVYHLLDPLPFLF